MSFLLMNRCCLCVDLRIGSYIIGILYMISRVYALTVNCLYLAGTDALIHGHHGTAIEDVAFHRLISIVSAMVLCFEILLGIALLFGLYKRLDQHLEMYYVGSFAFLVVGFVLHACTLMRYAGRFGALAWVFVSVEIFVQAIQVYFLLVIRSYYYKMKGENQLEDVQVLDTRDPAKSYYARTKPALHSNKP